MDLAGKTILVTGGAGFIGSHLVEWLIEHGHRTIVLDNFRNGSRDNLAAVAASPLLDIIPGDITDAAVCRRACQQAEVVFHLACLGVRHSLHNPVENHQVNALGSLFLLEAARAARIARLVYVSSSEVYGKTHTFPITENTPTWPVTVYGSSKLAGENYARSYGECFGLPVVCVRPFNNYGPRSHFEGDAGEVLPRFILRALAGLPPVIFGRGDHTRDFLFVKDCVAALVEIAACDPLVGQVVNVGYGQETRIDELAGRVLELTGRQDLVPVLEAERPGDVPRLWVEMSKLRSHLRFEPQYSLRQGLVATIEYFRAYHARHPDCGDRIKIRNWEV